MADTLKRYCAKIDNGADTDILGTAATTKTVLSVSVCNTSATDITFDLFARDSNAAQHNVLNDQSLPAGSTFIWNSKLVFVGSGEYLKLHPSASVSDIFVITSYLDQTA